MPNQPVHGVKGELLSRNRTLTPLAGSRQEYWFFFPHGAGSTALQALHEASPHCYVSSRRVAAWLHQIGSHMRRIQHHFGLPRSGRRGIPALEPSFTGAGKKAAYPDRACRTAEVLATASRNAVWRSEGNVPACCKRAERRVIQRPRYRSGASCVKHRVSGTNGGKTSTQTESERVATQLKKGRQRPLEG